MQSVSQWSFVNISSKHFHSQTVRAKDLQFWEKVYLPPPVTCHVSHGFFFGQSGEASCGGSVINGATLYNLSSLGKG